MLTSTTQVNSAYTALDRAIEDIRKGKAGSIPRNLQNKHYDGEDVQGKRGSFTSTPRSPLPLAAAAVSAGRAGPYYESSNNKTNKVSKHIGTKSRIFESVFRYDRVSDKKTEVLERETTGSQQSFLWHIRNRHKGRQKTLMPALANTVMQISKATPSRLWWR